MASLFASMNSNSRENVNGELNFFRSFVSLHLCKEYVHCGNIQNTFLTPDKVLNFLIDGPYCFDEIQYVAEHVKSP